MCLLGFSKNYYDLSITIEKVRYCNAKHLVCIPSDKDNAFFAANCEDIILRLNNKSNYRIQFTKPEDIVCAGIDATSNNVLLQFLEDPEFAILKEFRYALLCNKQKNKMGYITPEISARVLLQIL